MNEKKRKFFIRALCVFLAVLMAFSLLLSVFPVLLKPAKSQIPGKQLFPPKYCYQHSQTQKRSKGKMILSPLSACYQQINAV